MARLAVFAALFGLLLAACSGVQEARPAPGSEEIGMTRGEDSVRQWTHASGIRVVHRPWNAVPVVALQLRVGVGSADEDPAQAGIAHVHEHMLFRGTARRPEGTLAHEVEAVGGAINAWTGFDETVVHLVLPAAEVELGADVLFDAVFGSTFETGVLARELDVIAEEIRRGLDMPTKRLSHALFAEVFRQHPYGRPVIGSPEAVAALDSSSLQAFRERWVHPANVTLVVAGAVDAETVVRLLDAHAPESSRVFGGAAERAEEPEQSEARGVEVRLAVEDAHVAIAFRGPPHGHEDAPLLDMLLVLLGQGESSVLFEEVQRRRGMVSSVYSYLHAPREPGLAILGASVPVGEGGDVAVGKVIEAMLREVALLRHRAIPGEALQRIRRMLESDAVYQGQTVQGMAQRLGHFAAVAGDARHGEVYLERALAASPEDLRQVAGRWFVPEAMTVALLVPTRASAVDVERLVADGAGVFAAVEREVEPPALVREERGVVVHRFPSGLLLIVEEDDAVPLFSARVAVRGGVLLEEPRLAGRDHLLAELLLSGTERRSAGDIARALDRMAATMSGFAGRHSVGAQVTALNRDFAEAMGLLGEVVFSSAFPSAEVERLRRETLQRMQALDDNLAARAYRAFEEAMFEGHPYTRSVLGTEVSLRRVDRESIRGRHAELFVPEGMVITVVGDVAAEEVVAVVGAHFEGRAGGEESGAADRREEAFGDIMARSWVPGAGGREVRLLRDREQVHVVVGWPGAAHGTADADALQVLAAVLGGQSGRLFGELRDERGLVYSVSARSTAGAGAGAFTVYLATSPGRLDEAVEAVREVMADVRGGGVSEEEVERARRRLSGRQLLAMQRNSVRAAQYASSELLGTGWNWGQSEELRLAAVDATAVREAATRWLAEAEEVRVVLGPLAGELEAEE